MTEPQTTLHSLRTLIDELGQPTSYNALKLASRLRHELAAEHDQFAVSLALALLTAEHTCKLAEQNRAALN